MQNQGGGGRAGGKVLRTNRVIGGWGARLQGRFSAPLFFFEDQSLKFGPPFVVGGVLTLGVARVASGVVLVMISAVVVGLASGCTR